MTRRDLVAAAAAGATSAAMAGEAAAQTRRRAAPPPPRQKPATFVLVHGAWHGGWCWRDVRRRLEAQGHTVFTPTLTGLGERSHLRSPIPSLATHIQDIVNVIEWEELSDVVLCGHSYGGMVVTGVCDALKDRIRHVVYLDAAVPKDGDTFFSQSPGATDESIATAMAGMKALAPDGQWMGVFPTSVLGIPDDHPLQPWVARRLTPHPLRTWTDGILLPNGGSDGLARTYVLCTAPVMTGASFELHAQVLKTDPTWRYREIATGHDAMVTAPAQTAALLMEAAAAA